MGQPVEFSGQTTVFGPPKGKEKEIRHLPVFGNGISVVSCWEFSEEEWADMEAAGRKCFISVLSGGAVFPMYAGSEKMTASVVADTGRVWKKED